MYKKIISVMSVALVVFLCFNFNIYATEVDGSNTTNNFDFDLDGTSSNIIRATVRTTTFWYEEESFDDGNGSIWVNAKYDVLVRVNLINDTNKDVQIGVSNFSLKFDPTYSYPSSVFFRPVSYEYQTGLLCPTFMSNSGEVNLAVASESDYITWITIPALSQVTSVFTIKYVCTTSSAGSGTTPPSFGTNGVTWYYPSLPVTWAYVQDIRTDNFGYIKLLYQRFKEFLNSYNANVPASQDVTNDASSSSTVIDNQHQQESNIYNQTNQAIGNTGIQNFQFDSQTIGGLGGVKNDFMAVWNSLGSFNSVFITSLTIGLALSIVRHRRMFKQ